MNWIFLFLTRKRLWSHDSPLNTWTWKHETWTPRLHPSKSRCRARINYPAKKTVVWGARFGKSLRPKQGWSVDLSAEMAWVVEVERENFIVPTIQSFALVQSRSSSSRGTKTPGTRSAIVRVKNPNMRTYFVAFPVAHPISSRILRASVSDML